MFSSLSLQALPRLPNSYEPFSRSPDSPTAMNHFHDGSILPLCRPIFSTGVGCCQLHLIVSPHSFSSVRSPDSPTAVNHFHDGSILPLCRLIFSRGVGCCQLHLIVSRHSFSSVALIFLKNSKAVGFSDKNTLCSSSYI